MHRAAVLAIGRPPIAWIAAERAAMSESKKPQNHSPYQQKIIRRYYDNLGDISAQRLADLVGELYLAEGKKKERVWKQTEEAMRRLQVPEGRITHLMTQQNPALIAEIVKELEKK